MSPELETLDQLQGGDLPLATIRTLFESDAQFIHAITAMLDSREIRLIEGGADLPKWRRRELLSDADQSQIAQIVVRLTEIGARRIR